MKFRVERDVLAEAVTWVARGLPARPPVPVLAGVLIDAADEGSITLSAFDYEVSARVTVPADVETSGTVLVGGRLLADITRNLPHKTIELDADGAKVQITCGSSRFSLQRMPESEYPTLPTSPAGSGTVKGDVFTQAVAQVAVAADRGDTLPILTGVRVEIEGEKVTLLATDRYRLARRELTWSPSSTDASYAALIPARTLSDTAKALGASGAVTVSLGGAAGGDGLAGFEAGQRRTTTRLLDGEYPKVSSLFPTSFDTEATVDTAALIEAVRRVALVTVRDNPIRMSFTDGSLTIEAGSGDDAQASEAVDCQLTGPTISTAFNPTYLLDGLGALGSAWTKLSFTQPGKPAVISGQTEPGTDDDEHGAYRYVLMPVRFAS